MERDPRYGEQSVPPRGIPETEEELVERGERQNQEDAPRPGEPSFAEAEPEPEDEDE
jgi:hypothetical protein